MRLITIGLLTACLGSFASATQPLKQFTPGQLCSEQDPNFKEYRYKAHVAVCARNVSHDEKLEIAKNYGIDESDWKNYEFDHLIPLNAGGSDAVENIWPQPLAEARDKDLVEQATSDGLNSGQLDQAQAVQMIWDWINKH
jgi:hypothetical protein